MGDRIKSPLPLWEKGEGEEVGFGRGVKNLFLEFRERQLSAILIGISKHD